MSAFSFTRWRLLAATAGLIISLPSVFALAEDAAAPPKRNWIPSTAYLIPKETAPEGEGYFSIITGNNGRQYIGTHANAVNSWLVEFDPESKAMKVVVDAHKAIGKDIKGFGSQAKIHTRNNVGPSGKIYFGTKQGYPNAEEKREDYPGGYPMVYDPATGETKVYDIPVPHHGINSIAPDESRGLAYISTCSDHRPGPGENSIFLKLDLKTGKYQTLMDTEHYYGFIVVDHLGRAYHPILGGDIARYNPDTDKLERLKQTIDGQSPTPESRLALLPNPDPINWDISPDGKTLYSQPMSGNGLYSYDLTQEGTTLAGKSLGPVIPGATSVDCRAMCVGRSGTVWSATTEGVTQPESFSLLHLTSYRPGDKAPIDHGPVSVSNPDYTPTIDKDGKPIPVTGGIFKTADGTWTTKHVILGASEGLNNKIYILALIPFTVLEVDNPRADK